MDLRQVTQQLDELKQLLQQSNPNLEKGKELINKLKVALAYIAYPGSTVDEETTKKLLLARDILENGVFLSIKTQDVPSFERYVAQLKTFYYDYSRKFNLPESSNQYMVLGLNLLSKLAKNKLDEFHTELELIPKDAQQNTFIQLPVYLEQCMMEGAYNKVIQVARGNAQGITVPSNTYHYFLNVLADTVRNEIADCIICSYVTVSVNDAAKLLGFTDPSQVKGYAQSRSWVTSKGTDGTEFFKFRDEHQQQTYKKKQQQPQDQDKMILDEEEELPASVLIKRTLLYARELEKIV